MVGQLNELVSVYRNYVTMLELNGYKSVFSQAYGTSVELVQGLKPFWLDLCVYIIGDF